MTPDNIARRNHVQGGTRVYPLNMSLFGDRRHAPPAPAVIVCFSLTRVVIP